MEHSTEIYNFLMIIDREIDCVLRPGEGRKGSLYIGNLAGA